MNVVGISGSLRAASFNTALLEAAGRLVEAEGATFTVASIAQVPLYDGDLDTDERRPAAVAQLIAAIYAADGLLLATPEYNYGLSGVLKNAIDWASRPAYKSALTGRPCGVLSASMSALGGVRAQMQLRDVLAGTLSPVYPSPDFALARAQDAFDDDGALRDAGTRDFLRKYVQGFLVWSAAHNNV